MASTGSSCRTRRRVEEAPAAGPDMLMSLPPAILDNILARLPFKRLVRTSCLSRAWLRRWESLADLDIWFSPGSSAAPDDCVLRRCAAPLRSFTARVHMRHFDRADGWLRALESKRVEKLVLEFDDSRLRVFGDVVGINLPALFSHRELAHLDLGGCCYIPRAPRGFGGFPNLVKLVLNRVRLPFSSGAAQLERLISSAPHLTELSLNEVSTTHFQRGAVQGTCAIRAPNLRILKLIMFSDNGCRVAEEFPLLEEAAISIDCLLETEEFIDTFRRIASVKELCFHTHSNQVTHYALRGESVPSWRFDVAELFTFFSPSLTSLTTMWDSHCNQNPLEGISWKFQNLRVATLSANFGKLSSIMSIFSLLRCAPQIEKLEIEVEKTIRQDDEDDENFLDPDTDDDGFDEETVDDAIDDDRLNEEAGDDLFVSLKHVSLNDINYIPNEVCFMKFLLSKTGSLESFVVSFGSQYVKERARAELATWRKASPQAKLSARLVNQPAPNPNDS